MAADDRPSARHRAHHLTDRGAITHAPATSVHPLTRVGCHSLGSDVYAVVRGVNLAVLASHVFGYERSIVVEVWDSMTELLKLPEHDHAAEPMGLELVDARAKTWGFDLASQGRVMWAELDAYERTATSLPKRQVKQRPPKSLEQTIQDLDLLQRVRDGIERL